MSQPPQFPSYTDRPHDRPDDGRPQDATAWVPPSSPAPQPLSPPAYPPHPAYLTETTHPAYQQLTTQQPAAPSAYPGAYPGTAYMQPVAAPPGTNGLALGALVTGLMGLGPVPIGLGVGALMTLRRSGEGGRGLAIAGIVLGAVGILFWGALALLGVLVEEDDPYAVPDVPAASAEPAQSAADPVDIGELQLGACFDDGPDDFEATERSCTSAHDGEVFSTLVLGPRAFPGDRAVRDEAQASCDREFGSYVGIDVHRSRLETDVLYPDRSMWEDGYRDVMCLAYGPDGEQLQATVKGSRR